MLKKVSFLLLFAILDIVWTIRTNATYFYNENYINVIAHRGASAYLPENTL